MDKITYSLAARRNRFAVRWKKLYSTEGYAIRAVKARAKKMGPGTKWEVRAGKWIERGEVPYA